MLSAALLTLGLVAAADDTPPPAIERIALVSGAVLEAPVVSADDAAVRVDLGFTAIDLPADQVAARTPAAGAAAIETAAEAVVEVAAPDPYSGRLFREETGLEPRSLDDNVKAVGEAVVLVRSPVGLGSGFVVHPEGYVMTNDHVVAGSNELTVVVYRQAADGLRKDEYKKIRIVATSDLLDLALLKIEPETPETFVTVPLGDSHALTQGETVFAVGNPMGLERTLSEGIVGVRSRLLSGQTYVQTTTPISPGNSGGPLFNLAGEVVGVNSLKIVSMGAEGLGFSIPVNRVKAFILDQEAYAFDPLNANTGFEYYPPPTSPDAANPAPSGDAR